MGHLDQGTGRAGKQRRDPAGVIYRISNCPARGNSSTQKDAGMAMRERKHSHQRRPWDLGTSRVSEVMGGAGRFKGEQRLKDEDDVEGTG